MTTITESPPDADGTGAEASGSTIHPQHGGNPLERGVTGMLTTTSHRRIGSMYTCMAVVLGVAVTVVSAIVGFENVDPDSLGLFRGETGLAQSGALGLSGVSVLVVMPLLVGIGTAVVPLQVGSPSIAFPRAAAAGFWIWLVGAGAYVGSFIVDGGFVSGINVDNRAVALTIAALGVTVAGLLLSMVCIATTVIALRPAGMSLRRVPALSYSFLVASVVWLLSMAVLFADLVIAYVILQHTDRDVEALSSIAWMFTAPQVFAFALPALGIIADIVQVSTQTKQKMYDVLLGGLALFGFLSFGAFAQSAYDLGTRDVTDELVYILMGLALVLPALVIFGGFADTLRLGRKGMKAGAALFGAMAGLLMIMAGVFANALRVLGHWGELGDWNQTGIMDFGVMNYALFGAFIAATAGLIFWAPKIYGRRLNDKLGGLALLVLLIGTVVLALPQIIAGFFETNADFTNVLTLISVIGCVVVIVGIVDVLLILALGILPRATEMVPDNPVNGFTLEWATTSPPPRGNFAAPVPMVMSATPLLDAVPDEAPQNDDEAVRENA